MVDSSARGMVSAGVVSDGNEALEGLEVDLSAVDAV